MSGMLSEERNGPLELDLVYVGFLSGYFIYSRPGLNYTRHSLIYIIYQQ